MEEPPPIPSQAAGRGGLPAPYLSVGGGGGRGRGQRVPFLLRAGGHVGAGHGGDGVGAELRVLALRGRHGHDGLGQAAADGLCGEHSGG